MRSFHDTPIRRKLILISLLSSAASLVLAGTGFLAYELGAHRQATLRQLESIARMVAANSAAALDFDDVHAAQTTLSALRAETNVATACIYGADGALFASYRRNLLADACAETLAASAPSSSAGLALSIPIRLARNQIGSVRIRSVPIDLLQAVLLHIEIVGIVMLVSALAALPLVSALQRFISTPILRLVETSKRISADKDVSVRAEAGGRDEIGELVTAFNEMLEEIEARDQALAKHRNNLETEVERRTAELRTANEQLRSEMAERKRAQEQTHQLAYYDALTGLPNRQNFRERLERILSTARRKQHVAAILFIDLDGFKQVNDTLGHGAGDTLLREVAERLAASVRATDLLSHVHAEEQGVSRLGGDEFTVLLPVIRDAQDAAQVAERALEALAEPILIDGNQIYTTASIGIAIFPGDGEDSETLLRNADTAMYHAKARHPNGFQFYTEEMNARAARKLTIANRLRPAVRENQLRVFYQPFREVSSGRVRAAEALLRWHDEALGNVRTDEMIDIAEDTGMIIEIGEWVLRTACTQSRSWQDAGFQPIRISVNVSTHQLRHPAWPGTVARVLEEARLSPDLLELEVTESAILERDDATVLALGEIANMGVHLALDDFGTGYSSLSYLRRFPIDRVKIDRTFVNELTTAGDDARIASAILSMAKSLNLSVVAEGVETVEQAEFLSARGCQELQGYLFGAPVPAEEFERFLEREKED